MQKKAFIEWLAQVSQLAGLLHDFGKMAQFFQKSLRGTNNGIPDPIRHERLSANAFIAMCYHAVQQDEQASLSTQNLFRTLSHWQATDFNTLFGKGFLIKRDHIGFSDHCNIDAAMPEHTWQFLHGSFAAQRFPAVAMIEYLILSHHFAPYSEKGTAKLTEKRYVKSKKNSVPFYMAEKKERLEPLGGQAVWNYPDWLSAFQQTCRALSQSQTDNTLPLAILLNATHLLARPALISADQCVSSQDNKMPPFADDSAELCFANTCKGDPDQPNQLAQLLHIHTLRVAEMAAHYTQLLGDNWNDTRLDYAATPQRLSERRVETRFAWQVEAEDIARNIHQRAKPGDGYFGVVMAETGSGKTQANARIMCHLQGGNAVRFTLALGLRTLTEQSGKAYIKEIGFLENIEVSVLVGGEYLDYETKNPDTATTLDGEQAVAEEVIGRDTIDPSSSFPRELAGPATEGDRSRRSEKLAKMAQAPILVCTIDHLMSGLTRQRSSHSKRLLRIASSDLVIDEIDSFAQEDIEALARLVYFTGLAGRRVLLSSATTPPEMALQLFKAYLKGYSGFCHITENTGVIHCAWHTNIANNSTNISIALTGDASDIYKKQHRQQAEATIAKLAERPPQKKATFIPIPPGKTDRHSVCERVARGVNPFIDQFHEAHAVRKGDVRLSMGLIRLSNTQPAISFFHHLCRQPSGPLRIYVFYQAKLAPPILERVETMLDRLLRRKHKQDEPDPIWDQPEVKNILKMNPTAKDIQVIVIATPIEEVGRDHDFDWVILEPTSHWSLIQTVGRLWRHRVWKKLPNTANVGILSANIASMLGRSLPYSRPGPENEQHKLIQHHDASRLFDPRVTDVIDARFCIEDQAFDRKDQPFANFGAIEHARIENGLRPIVGDTGNTTTQAELDDPIMAVSDQYEKKHPFRDSSGQVDVEITQRDGCIFYKTRHMTDARVLHDSLIDDLSEYFDDNNASFLLNYGKGYQNIDNNRQTLQVHQGDPIFEQGVKTSDGVIISAVVGLSFLDKTVSFFG